MYRFFLCLLKQVKQRLPSNLNVLEKMSLLSPSNSLNAVKEPLTPLLEEFNLDVNLITKIEYQYQNLNLTKWTETGNTKLFWAEVEKFRDASGLNPFQELCDFALQMLVLPLSNAEVERIFSQMNIVKSKLRNKLKTPMVNALLSIRFGLRRHGKCCHNYAFEKGDFKRMKSSQEKQTPQTNNENEDDDIFFFSIITESFLMNNEIEILLFRLLLVAIHILFFLLPCLLCNSLTQVYI